MTGDPFAAMDAEILATLGTAAFYTPAGRSTRSIQVAREDNVEGVSEHGQVLHFGTVFDIAREDIDEPAKGDTIQIDRTQWTVHEIVERDQYMTRVSVRG